MARGLDLTHSPVTRGKSLGPGGPLPFIRSKSLRITQTLTLATALTLGAASAQAGGLSPSVPAAPVTVHIEPAPVAETNILIPILGSALIIGLMALAASDCGPCAK